MKKSYIYTCSPAADSARVKDSAPTDKRSARTHKRGVGGLYITGRIIKWRARDKSRTGLCHGRGGGGLNHLVSFYVQVDGLPMLLSLGASTKPARLALSLLVECGHNDSIRDSTLPPPPSSSSSSPGPRERHKCDGKEQRIKGERWAFLLSYILLTQAHKIIHTHTHTTLILLLYVLPL